MASVLVDGPIVTVMPPRETTPPALVVDVDPDEDLYPCSFCGSTGTCEHLMRVIHVPGKDGEMRAIPIRAELGAEWGRQRMIQLIVDLAEVYLEGRRGEQDG